MLSRSLKTVFRSQPLCFEYFRQQRSNFLFPAFSAYHPLCPKIRTGEKKFVHFFSLSVRLQIFGSHFFFFLISGVLAEVREELAWEPFIFSVFGIWLPTRTNATSPTAAAAAVSAATRASDKWSKRKRKFDDAMPNKLRSVLRDFMMLSLVKRCAYERMIWVSFNAWLVIWFINSTRKWKWSRWCEWGAFWVA